MSSVSRDAERRQLERETRREGHETLLRLLQEQHPLLRGFGDWEEVVAFMRKGTPQDPSKDALLLPIFVAHVSDRDPRWRTILFVIFWPALESIHRRKRHWDTDPDALWSNIEWSFLRTVCRLDPSRRRERLVQKVFNDVVHLLHDEYRRAWDQAQQQQVTDPEELAALQQAEESWDAAAGPPALAKDLLIQRVGIEVRGFARRSTTRAIDRKHQQLLDSAD